MTSRYFNEYYNTNEDEARLVSERFVVRSVPYITHVVEAKESFESLANRYFGNEKLYWYIADQNPQIKFPDTIPVGTLVRIPIR